MSEGQGVGSLMCRQGVSWQPPLLPTRFSKLRPKKIAAISRAAPHIACLSVWLMSIAGNSCRWQASLAVIISPAVLSKKDAIRVPS